MLNAYEMGVSFNFLYFCVSTFRQKRVKTDIEVNEDNDSVFYRQPIYYHFRPDMTNGSLDDVISIVNLPYVVSSCYIFFIVPYVKRSNLN